MDALTLSCVEAHRQPTDELLLRMMKKRRAEDAQHPS